MLVVHTCNTDWLLLLPDELTVRVDACRCLLLSQLRSCVESVELNRIGVSVSGRFMRES